VFVAAGIFVATTVALILHPNLYLGVFDSVLAYSIVPVMHHYFPAKGQPKIKSEKTKK
jgi:hypothetical protein